MTDSEKINEIYKYVTQMSPIFRPAVLLDPETMAYNNGYDAAMYNAQQDLLEILNG